MRAATRILHASICLFAILVFSLAILGARQVKSTTRFRALTDDGPFTKIAEARRSVDRGDFTAGITHLDEAINGFLKMSDAGARVELSLAMTDCLVQRGNVHRAMHRLDSAIEDFSYAAQTFEFLVEFVNETDARPRLARCFEYRGNTFFARRQYSDALHDFDSAVKVYTELIRGRYADRFAPDFARSLIHRGGMFRITSQLSDAKRDFMAAIMACDYPKPDGRTRTNAGLVAVAYLNLSVVSLMEGNFASASVAFENAIMAIRPSVAHLRLLFSIESFLALRCI
jgi:tetratricopeptide (TPR) repeat protein